MNIQRLKSGSIGKITFGMFGNCGNVSTVIQRFLLILLLIFRPLTLEMVAWLPQVALRNTSTTCSTLLGKGRDPFRRWGDLGTQPDDRMIMMMQGTTMVTKDMAAAPTAVAVACKLKIQRPESSQALKIMAEIEKGFDEMDSKALPGIVDGGNLDEPTTTRIVIDPSQDVGGGLVGGGRCRIGGVGLAGPSEFHGRRRRWPTR